MALSQEMSDDMLVDLGDISKFQDELRQIQENVIAYECPEQLLTSCVLQSLYRAIKELEQVHHGLNLIHEKMSRY